MHKIWIAQTKLNKIKNQSSDFAARSACTFFWDTLYGWVVGKQARKARPVVAELRSIAKRGSPQRELSAACNAVGIKGEPSRCMEMQDRCARSRPLFHEIDRSRLMTCRQVLYTCHLNSLLFFNLKRSCFNCLHLTAIFIFYIFCNRMFAIFNF